MREMELRPDQRIDRMVTRLGSLMVVLLGLRCIIGRRTADRRESANDRIPNACL